ncbi:hypothetical protein NEUTE1DRAFT_93395 [Neurospora tetrasperma FGSC 2508]|uniref:Heterokaryon incompatibility domain-containing protein n=1 Tax=Neurospora tetrasperma (strain FGSC 2508 / ATCC MYA-4615 / P0657) TaxID=510951 RepID=F8N049_NEUT8|nr:uncharacterized protein NEUTE1DRAFT_93395 [Neurospora tetrasperma FGSC 2508]EGO53784.1 hypothetical protein NEUTE1DRAFT_93395 [Neurospora tetrasperma FGSC 2508]EGZ76134.1 hypothetical protein NEUTE2DRAFT_76343 [Neurospora tetrasperma FGSC 2509]
MWVFRRSPKTPPQTVVPHILCDCCSRIVKKSKIIQAFAAGQDINNIIDSPSEWFFHNHNVNNLSKSSAAGCHLCSLAIAQLNFSSPRNDLYGSSVLVRAWNGLTNKLEVVFEFHSARLKVTDELTKQHLLQAEHACVWAGYLNDAKFCTKSDFELLCGYGTARPISDTMPQGLPCGRQNPRFTFAQAWLRVVRGYERTEFTYESDRLIALSGVAKAIEHSKGFTYVAGTWKELWPLDALWWYEREPSREEQTGSTKLKAPSWSWADRKWAKKFALLDDIGLDIHQIIYLAQFDEFTCPTSTARYIGTRADEEGITLTTKGPVRRGLVHRSGRVGVLLTSDEEWVDVYWDLGQIPKLGESVLLLILISGKNIYGVPVWAGLVLVREEGAPKKDGQPCYRRVGYFEGGFGNHETWGEEAICLC